MRRARSSFQWWECHRIFLKILTDLGHPWSAPGGLLICEPYAKLCASYVRTPPMGLRKKLAPGREQGQRYQTGNCASAATPQITQQPCDPDWAGGYLQTYAAAADPSSTPRITTLRLRVSLLPEVCGWSMLHSVARPWCYVSAAGAWCYISSAWICVT